LIRPTLQGRVLRVLLAALGLVVVALLAVDYAAFRASVSERVALKSAAEGLAEAIDGVDEAVAAPIVQATERQFNRSRRASALPGIEDLLFQLQAADGRIVYASASIRAEPAFSNDTARGNELQLQGRAYWPWLHESVRWRIVVLEPVVRDGLVLQWLSGGLLQALLIAMPLLTLPLWWAVRTGLAPLRRLVSTLAARDPADLTPLNLDLRYPELQPIVGAVDGLLDRARAQMSREREWVQNAAHELRTPLAVMGAHAHALAFAPDETAAAAARQGISRGVQRASHLVEQLLALARLETPAAAGASQTSDLVAHCRQRIVDLTPLADARGIALALDSPDTLQADIQLDSLHSILDNLLRNALNHCPSGSHVDLRLALDGHALRIEVVDDGPGLPEHERLRAFERFFRGQAAGPGSGLGLAIVRQATLRLGGQVSLAPGPGDRGLRVTVRLPI